MEDQKRSRYGIWRAVLTMFYIFVFFFGLCSTVEAKTTKNIDKQVGKTYARIIERYKDCYDRNRAHVQHNVESGVNYYFCEHMRNYSQWFSKFVYKIKDYNGDGIPELFVGLLGKEGVYMKESNVWIFDAYTFRNGKVQQLSDHIGDRTGSITLCKDGIIEDRFSGGAADYGIYYHRISKKTGKLTFLLKITSESNFELQNRFFYKKEKDKKKTMISDKEYDRLQRKNGQRIRTLFFDGTRKAIREVKRGNFKYKGQKNWNLKTL